jgi:hypothetical protein
VPRHPGIFVWVQSGRGQEGPGPAGPLGQAGRASRAHWLRGTFVLFPLCFLQVPPQRTSSLDLLRASLLNSGIGVPPKRTPSAQAVALLAQPSLLKVLPVEEEEKGAWQLGRTVRRLWVRTGFSTHQLKLGIQVGGCAGML